MLSKLTCTATCMAVASESVVKSRLACRVYMMDMAQTEKRIRASIKCGDTQLGCPSLHVPQPSLA